MPKLNIVDYIRGGGVVVGDGSYLFTLERRGYILAGSFVPEVVLSHPEVVEQLSREFAMCGAQVIQAFTFAATEDKLLKHAISAGLSHERLVERAMDIAKKTAAPVDAYVCGGMSSTPSYRNGADPEVVKDEFRKMVKMFVEHDVDFLLGEFFHHIEEAILAIEVMKEISAGSKPIALTMAIGPQGDFNSVSPQDCAVQLVRAGADMIGVNCAFDPETSVETVAMMKKGLEEAGLEAVLMVQPCGYHCQDAKNLKLGMLNLPEYPLALEPRLVTRADCYTYARKAYDHGIRYIGGCCGFEPLHIRALAQELKKETGRDFPGKRFDCEWGDQSFPSYYAHRAGKEHWTKLVPALGRANVQAFSKPDIEEVKLS